MSKSADHDLLHGKLLSANQCTLLLFTGNQVHDCELVISMLCIVALAVCNSEHANA